MVIRLVISLKTEPKLALQFFCGVCFISMSQREDIAKEGNRAAIRVPFRHYITLTPTYESYFRGIDYVQANWKNKAGGDDEYIREFRGTWKRGGANLNSINTTVQPYRTNDEVNECGIMYPTTMLWESYGIDLSNIVQPSENFWKTRKNGTLLMDEKGEDLNGLFQHTTGTGEEATMATVTEKQLKDALKGKGLAEPDFTEWRDNKLGDWESSENHFPNGQAGHRVNTTADWTRQQQVVADRAAAK